MEDIVDSESTRSERHSKSSSPEPPHSHESQSHQQHRTRDDDDESSTGSPHSTAHLSSAASKPPPSIPTLRLNVALASDPASNPDAKQYLHIRVKSEDKSDEVDDDDDVTLIDHDSEDVENNLDSTNIPKSPLKHHHSSASPAAAAKETVNSIMAKNMEMLPRPNVFMCQPCGIRFSSLSTLEAHQTYYCSHRKDADDNTKAAGGGDVNGSEPPNKSIKTGKQYACTQCSYSADKKVSLNRHMRMHQTSPTPSSVSNGADEAPTSQLVVPASLIGQVQQQQQVVVDRYCSNCDIRFSSTKTYRAHKQHYCSGRHRDGWVNRQSSQSSNSDTNSLLSKLSSQSSSSSCHTTNHIVRPEDAWSVKVGLAESPRNAKNSASKLTAIPGAAN